MNITELIAEAELANRIGFDREYAALSRKILPLLVAVIKNQQRQIETAILALENLEDPVLSDTVSTTAEDALTEIIALDCQLEDVKP